MRCEFDAIVTVEYHHKLVLKSVPRVLDVCCWLGCSELCIAQIPTTRRLHGGCCVVIHILDTYTLPASIFVHRSFSSD